VFEVVFRVSALVARKMSSVGVPPSNTSSVKPVVLSGGVGAVHVTVRSAPIVSPGLAAVRLVGLASGSGAVADAAPAPATIVTIATTAAKSTATERLRPGDLCSVTLEASSIR
jgi:hypothetical protein